MKQIKLPSKAEFEAFQEIATYYISTHKGLPSNHDNYVDRDTRYARALVAMLQGYFAGVDPIAAINAYYVASFDYGKTIKVEPAPDERLRLVTEHPKYDWRPGKVQDETVCQFEFRQQGGDGVWGEWRKFELTRKTADEMNLSKGNAHTIAQWSKHPAGMLRAKAIKLGTKMHCPDLHGYDIDIDGAMDAIADFGDDPDRDAYTEPDASDAPAEPAEEADAEAEAAPEEAAPVAEAQPVKLSQYDRMMAFLQSDKPFPAGHAEHTINTAIATLVSHYGAPEPSDAFKVSAHSGTIEEIKTKLIQFDKNKGREEGN